MANILSQAGIETSNTIEAWHVTQSIDAFTGTTAYDITISGSLTVTGSSKLQSITGSLLGTASYAAQALSASYSTQALSASYAPSAPAFPFTGSAQITGSLGVTGSVNVTRLGIGTIGSSTIPLDIKAPGLLSTDTTLKILNSSETDYLLNINGDGSVGIGSYGNIVARLWVNAKSTYGIYSAATGTHYSMYLASPNANVNHGYYASSIGASAAFKAEDPGGGTGGFKIGFAADSFGVNNGGYNIGFYTVVNPTTTGANVGIRIQATGSSTANYAIQITNGDISMAGGTKIGVTTGDLFSFWGATPTAQPTTSVGTSSFASVGGSNIQTNDTFDGYTMQQVVKALRNIGILA